MQDKLIEIIKKRNAEAAVKLMKDNGISTKDDASKVLGFTAHDYSFSQYRSVINKISSYFKEDVNKAVTPPVADGVIYQGSDNNDGEEIATFDSNIDAFMEYKMRSKLDNKDGELAEIINQNGSHYHILMNKLKQKKEAKAVNEDEQSDAAELLKNMSEETNLLKDIANLRSWVKVLGFVCILETIAILTLLLN